MVRCQRGRSERQTAMARGEKCGEKGHRVPSQVEAGPGAHSEAVKMKAGEAWESVDCPGLGSTGGPAKHWMFSQGDVWICMELMDTSLDKFYRKVLEKNMKIPEDILEEIAVSVSGLALPSMHRTCCVAEFWQSSCPL